MFTVHKIPVRIFIETTLDVTAESFDEAVEKVANMRPYDRAYITKNIIARGTETVQFEPVD
jgi:hypothetical protein